MINIVEFGEILKICRQTEQKGKLGKLKKRNMAFMYFHIEMSNLHHMLVNV